MNVQGGTTIVMATAARKVDEVFLSVVIPADEESLDAAVKTADTLDGVADEIIVVWHGRTKFMLAAEGPVRSVVIPLANAWDTALHVREGIRAVKGQWALVLFPGEKLAPADHVAIGASANFMGGQASSGLPMTLKEMLQHLPAEVVTGIQATMWCDDSVGLQCRAMTNDSRLYRVSCGIPFGWGSRGFQAPHLNNPTVCGIAPAVALARAPILKQTLPAFEFERGRFVSAMTLASRTASHMDRRFYVKARAEMDRAKVLAAFRELFDHMSLHEELWRLKEIFDQDLLPYTITELPEVDAMRKELEQQIGHLGGMGAKTEDWYRDGSPGEAITADLIRFAEQLPSTRVRWVMDEAKKHGFKKVAEFGSVDGPNIFTWTKCMPEVEWHGVEVNPAALVHAKQLMEETGVQIRMHNSTFNDFAWEHKKEFDAACVFEVLEHNDPGQGSNILSAAEESVKQGGRVYITTPLGAWSLHDESTRRIDLRKDHINAYTVKRMREFLSRRPLARDVVVEAVENGNYFEANGWVHATYRVERP